VIDFQVFLADGASAFGAVRAVRPFGRQSLRVNIEGAGDVEIPLDAVVKVVAQRVVVAWDRLTPEVQEHIRHTLDVEDFPPDDEPEAELEPASEDPEDEDDRSLYDGPLVRSPPDELNGRDVGSRYGAPPSVTSPRRPRT
jgi:hypothetical protein